MSLNLPPDLYPLESQVAGHTIETTSQTYGMLRNLTGKCVFKPLSKPVYAEREIAFYNQIGKNLFELEKFVPRYDGHLKYIIDGKEQLFIQMENITYAMCKPCVIDIKIGRRTWDPLATAKKITIEQQKYEACKKSLGLCIPGFQIYNSNGNCLKYGKDFGKSLDQKTLLETLNKFLCAQSYNNHSLIKAILSQLYGIQKWFTGQKSVNFYSSSILIAFDSEASKRKIKENSSTVISNGCRIRNKKNFDLNCSSWLKVKIIDFAHVFQSENNSWDANYLFGLQNLIYILQEILVSN